MSPGKGESRIAHDQANTNRLKYTTAPLHHRFTMNRMSVTFNDFIEEQLRKIQGELIMGLKRDVSFTTTVNVVLLAGMIGSKYLTKKDWGTLVNFLDEEQINIDAEGLTDHYQNLMK